MNADARFAQAVYRPAGAASTLGYHQTPKSQWSGTMVQNTPAGGDVRERCGTGASTPALNWTSLAEAFEASCLMRGSRLSTLPGAAGSGTGGVLAEFSRQAAAEQLAVLLERLRLPASREVVTAGVRHRYQVHRLYVLDRRESLAILASAWRQGKEALLAPAAIGSSAPRAARRLALAEAAWRAALLAAGRYLRRHALGVRVSDSDLAAVLVRSAHLLDVSAGLVRRSGCLLVTVPAGVDKERILQQTATPRWLTDAAS
jgi:hypothetical protein